LNVLEAMENTIPYLAMDRLLGECAATTGCHNFGLLVGQRASLTHLGTLGQVMHHSPNIGVALRTFATYQHLHSRGGVTFLFEKEGVATLCYAVL